jgi:hypothetical protein
VFSPFGGANVGIFSMCVSWLRNFFRPNYPEPNPSRLKPPPRLAPVLATACKANTFEWIGTG